MRHVFVSGIWVSVYILEIVNQAPQFRVEFVPCRPSKGTPNARELRLLLITEADMR